MLEDTKIRVCVIDDEPIACRKIISLVKDDSQIEIAKVCTNGDQAVEAIRELSPELIFLDVQMPGMNGFEVLESIRDIDRIPYVIFVTAFDRYAVRAFEVHALDYLLKPFDKQRFDEALRRAKTQMQNNKNPNYNRELLSLLNAMKTQPRRLDRLVINNRVLKADEIDWIEAQGKYCMIHRGHDSHLVREEMKDFEAHLDPGKFVRIHKSSIVNVERVERIQPLFHGDARIILQNGAQLTVSRRYRSKLNELFGKPL